ncbi:MAG: hypothetical protein GC136_02455 [Alphaproteobacteria bacterium]|nr:hypothetical protein [Alphaproteobacteria bacterium]
MSQIYVQRKGFDKLNDEQTQTLKDAFEAAGFFVVDISPLSSSFIITGDIEKDAAAVQEIVGDQFRVYPRTNYDLIPTEAATALVVIKSEQQDEGARSRFSTSEKIVLAKLFNENNIKVVEDLSHTLTIAAKDHTQESAQAVVGGKYIVLPYDRRMA